MILEHYTDEQLRDLLFSVLDGSREIRRKELIEHTLARTDLPESAKNDLSPGAPSIVAKSRIGAVLSSAIREGDIAEDALGYLTLLRQNSGKPSRGVLSEFITKLLREQGTLGKGRIFQLVERAFAPAGATRSVLDGVRSAAGQTLADLEQLGHIAHVSRGYCLTDNRGYPSNELGGYLREARTGGELRQCFLGAIHAKGGEWFESYCVNLLRAYYILSGKTVDEGSVTGGSEDGGIDGIIHTTDWLGYRETILMQMKNRNAVMTAKDVREFYGAVCAENGSRGVFITISGFHSEAQKLLDKVDNLIGIDGDKLFEIACRCRMGVCESRGERTLDDDFFLRT